MTIDADPRPLRQMLAELTADLRALAGRSVDLARAEISTARSEVTTSIVGIAAGAFAAIIGVLVLVSMLVLIAIALGLPPWAAAAVIGLLLTVGGAITARTFVARLRTAHFDLRETRMSVRETVEWLKAQSSR